MTRRGRLAAYAFLAAFPLAALAAPWLAPADPWTIDLDARLRPPAFAHLFGTDDLGRDVLSRVLWGSRVSVATGLLATLAALLAGGLVGAAGALGGRGVDRAADVAMNAVQSLPPLVLVVAGATILPPSFLSAVLLIGGTFWPESARVVRSEARRTASLPFVEAARAAGASRARLLLVHVLPAALRPALALAPYVLGAAVLTEASLSFLGLGVPPPTPSWGRALADARATMTEAWWCVVAPAAALLLLVLAARRAGEAAAATR